MSLGKGLESLIPPQNSENDNFPADETGTAEKTPSEKTRDFESSVIKEDLSISLPATDNRDYVFQLEIEKIRSNRAQPRKDFNEESLKELAASIREFGILQPLVVSKIEIDKEDGTDVLYELIAGERRLLAAKIAGLERVPAIVKNINLERERLELAVIENIQRENLNPIDTARAFSKLQEEFGLTQREIASRLGKSRETVANTIRLLGLSSKIQEALSRGLLSESHARLLLAIEEVATQDALFEEILKNNLTVRDVKKKMKEHKSKKEEPLENRPPEIISFEKELSSHLGAPVSIETKENSGKITIHFYSQEELNRIIDLFNSQDEI